MAAEIPSFNQLIPGFDFLQNLAKGTGLGVPGLGKDGSASGLPGFGQWVAPTLNPEELAKRIEELKTVQFWLESNAKLMGATIQALEVQRMTLSTLKTMNVQMGDLRDSMMAQVPDVLKPKTPAAKAADKPAAPSAAKPSTAAPTPPAIDPMQWWGALTQQFTQLATAALKDGPAEAAKQMAKADLSAFKVPGVSLPAAKKTPATGTAAAPAAPAAKDPAAKTTRTAPARKR